MSLEKMEDVLDVLQSDFIKVILSNKIDKIGKVNKVVVEKKLVENKVVYQMSSFVEKQVFHKNIADKNVVCGEIIELFKTYFKQINIFEKQANIEIKLSKKGKLLFSKQNLKVENTENLEHNKNKNYILKPELKIEPLIDLGVLTTNGQIVNKEYAKFKQINKFIENIDNSIKGLNKEKFYILDFGCGKSYLTFILYYYFNFIRKIDTTIIGIDLKEEVVDNCNVIAEKYGYKNLHFIAGDIEKYKPEHKFDMVVSLHACDIATDFALFNAIKWGVDYIFSVPCCHHEVAKQINKTMNSITKYSILKERFSALLTDSTRGNILESFGYNVKIGEFIDFEETPKNILIKAIKTSNKVDVLKLEQTKLLLDEYGVQQTLLEKCLKLISSKQ